ncbi:MAG: cupredoxin domain-containing protein [Betaproteobacteria bacterium]|nr:cupredoxin domain-containing protein [Betaproteobacteria bacterium]
MRTDAIAAWTRRRWLKAALAAAAPAALGPGAYHVAAASREVVIKMTVKRFEFSKKVIVVKKGVPLVIEITSLDVPHGFAVPDFHARAEIVMPGKVTQVRFTPDKAGEFPFLCDIFCGDKHEELEGRLIVGA